MTIKVTKLATNRPSTVVKKKREVNKNRNQDRDYINGPTMFKAIKDWYATEEVEIPRVLVDAVIQICRNLGTKYSFKNYSYKEEMIGNALEKCIMALQDRKFDPERYDNPFAYFTMIAWNEFIRVIQIEHKEAYVKHKSLELYMTEASLLGQPLELPEDDMSGRIDNLIEKFENKKTKKKDVDDGAGK